MRVKRAVAGEVSGFAHSGEITEAALKRAADAVRAVTGGRSGSWAAGPAATNVRLYGDDNPLASPGFSDKVALLQEIDAWARARDSRVVIDDGSNGGYGKAMNRGIERATAPSFAA